MLFPCSHWQVCLTLSFHRRALIRLHAHDPTQDTCHCEVYKNEKELDTYSGTQKPVSGPVAKNHSKPIKQTNPVRHGEMCTVRCPRIADKFIQLECKCVFTSLLQDTSDDTSSNPATTRSENTSIPASGKRSRDSTESKNTNKNRDVVPASRKKFRHLPEWLKELAENLEDEGVLASRDTPANTSQGSDSERPAKVVSRKRSLFTHFSQERNCEICKRTKITRAPCRKRAGDAVPRPENVGDFQQQITKFLNE